MPSLHVVIPRDLKRWIETRARREEISVSQYVRKALSQHRNTVAAEEQSSEPVTTREE